MIICQNLHGNKNYIQGSQLRIGEPGMKNNTALIGGAI